MQALPHEVFMARFLDAQNRVLDHFIMAGSASPSFAERGLL
jgi:hypothetical protein